VNSVWLPPVTPGVLPDYQYHEAARVACHTLTLTDNACCSAYHRSLWQDFWQIPVAVSCQHPWRTSTDPSASPLPCFLQWYKLANRNITLEHKSCVYHSKYVLSQKIQKLVVLENYLNLDMESRVGLQIWIDRGVITPKVTVVFFGVVVDVALVVEVERVRSLTAGSTGNYNNRLLKIMLCKTCHSSTQLFHGIIIFNVFTLNMIWSLWWYDTIFNSHLATLNMT